LTTYTLGGNCHLTLSHLDIDAGAPYGFMVSIDKIKAEGIRVNREVISDGTTLLWIYFDILTADRLICPDGSFCVNTKSQMDAKLQQFLMKTSGLILSTPAGSYLGLCALGFTADERHSPLKSIWKCQLNNIGYYWPPVPNDVLLLSVWDGTLTWGTSYWR
jgi:hypothetical protein